MATKYHTEKEERKRMGKKLFNKHEAAEERMMKKHEKAEKNKKKK